MARSFERERATGARLHSIERYDLALIWPVFRTLDQARSHRILPNVFPFLAHAFFVSQEVIEKAFLPNLSFGVRPTYPACKGLLQSSNPPTKNKVIAAANEQMNMVGHQDIPADRDIKISKRAFSKSDKRQMCTA